MVHHHHKMYSYAKMNSNLFHFSTPHNSSHSLFTKQTWGTESVQCTRYKHMYFIYIATRYVAGQQLYNGSVRSDTLYSCCPAMYQSVGETPTTQSISRLPPLISFNFPKLPPIWSIGPLYRHRESLIRNMFSFETLPLDLFAVLCWLVNKSHNLQGRQVPASRRNSERERGFLEVSNGY